MQEYCYPVLCGGTFLTLLLQVQKQRTKIRDRNKGGHDNLSNQNVLLGLIKVFNGSDQKPKGNSFKSITSGYKNCTYKNFSYLPFLEEMEIKIFDKNIKNDYKAFYEEMLLFITNFTDTPSSKDKSVWLVRALLELIENDQTIDNDQKFYILPNGEAISKFEMCRLSDVCLPAFLLGIWHFIICNKDDNTIGRSTIQAWYNPAKQKHAAAEYIGRVGMDSERQVNVYLNNDLVCNLNNLTNIDQNNDLIHTVQIDEENTDREFKGDIPIVISSESVDCSDNEVLVDNFQTSVANEEEYTIVENKHNVFYRDEMSPEQVEQVFKVFDNAIKKYGIKSVLASKHSITLSEYDNIGYFVVNINSNILVPFENYRNESIYMDICKFTNDLELFRISSRFPKLIKKQEITPQSLIALFNEIYKEDVIHKLCSNYENYWNF